MLRIMGIEIKTVKNNNNNLIDQNNELLERVDEVLHKVDVVQTKLNISVEDRAPQPDKIKEENVFFFLNVMMKIILIIQLELKILMQKKH